MIKQMSRNDVEESSQEPPSRSCSAPPPPGRSRGNRLCIVWHGHLWATHPCSPRRWAAAGPWTRMVDASRRLHPDHCAQWAGPVGQEWLSEQQILRWYSPAELQLGEARGTLRSRESQATCPQTVCRIRPSPLATMAAPGSGSHNPPWPGQVLPGTQCMQITVRHGEPLGQAATTRPRFVTVGQPRPGLQSNPRAICSVAMGLPGRPVVAAVAAGQILGPPHREWLLCRARAGAKSNILPPGPQMEGLSSVPPCPVPATARAFAWAAPCGHATRDAPSLPVEGPGPLPGYGLRAGPWPPTQIATTCR